MANINRVRAQRILDHRQGAAMSQTGHIDRGFLKLAGVPDDEIGSMEMRKHQAEQLAASQKGQPWQ